MSAARDDEPDPDEERLGADSQAEQLMVHSENDDIFEDLVRDFQDMMSDKQVLRSCIAQFIEHTVDELTLGVIFDTQRKYRTNGNYLEVESDEEDSNDGELFQQHNRNQDCICLNCNGSVVATRFASHLQSCMGIGGRQHLSRNSANSATNNKEKPESNTYSNFFSDSEDDSNRSSAKKKRNRKKKKEVKKKSRGDEEELTNFRDVLHLQERRAHSSSTNEDASSSTNARKHDKSKKRSRGKDGGSPGGSMMVD